MNNFKSGSGNLDFGGGDEDDGTDTASAETSEKQPESERVSESTSAEQSTPTAPDKAVSDAESQSEQPASDQESTGGTVESGSSSDEYPYFVRRSNVGDERETRLEIHVRDKVANQEARFRNELADQLGTNEISKTDAREFALLAAFEYPERVAELMQDEGFGALD